MTAPHFKTGDAVWIQGAGQRVEGMIELASGNGKSLMLAFDGFIDGHLGMMPVLLAEDGMFISIMTGIGVTVTPRTLS